MTQKSLKGHYAGFVSRLLAYAIDLGIIVILLIFGGWLWQTVSSFFQFGFFADASSLFFAFIAGISAILTSAVYYIFFWVLAGQTPGKLLLGIRIVGLDSDRITFWQALRRYVGYYLSALALYAGYWWVLIDNRRQGWHDKLAGTYVIYVWDARVGAYMQAQLEDQRQTKDGSEEANNSV